MKLFHFTISIVIYKAVDIELFVNVDSKECDVHSKFFSYYLKELINGTHLRKNSVFQVSWNTKKLDITVIII